MRMATHVLLICAMVLSVGARADGLTIFNIQGTLQSGRSATGTISVSPSGLVINVNVALTDFGATYQFGGPIFTGANPGLYEIFSDAKPNSTPDYLLLAFSQANLTGFMGGPLCSLTVPCSSQPLNGNGSVSDVQLNFGYSDSPNFKSVSDTFSSLSASVPSVPEPNTLLLAVTGLMASAGVIRSRWRG